MSKAVAVISALVFGILAAFVSYFYGRGFYVAILALTAILPFILGPVFVYREHSFLPALTHKPIDAARDVIPQDFWDRVALTTDALAPFGFKVKGNFQLLYRSRVIGFLTFLENSELDFCELFVSFPMKGYREVTEALDFFTEFLDGKKITTTNDKTSEIEPSVNDCIELWLPDLTEASELYMYHRKAVGVLATSAKKPLQFDLPELFKQAAEKQNARRIQLGYYNFDDKTRRLRPTWKGATLRAWSSFWPLKQMQRAWRKHQTNKLLRKLEE